MKKKLLSLVLVFSLMAVLLAGCGGKTVETEQPEDPSEVVAEESVSEDVPAEEVPEERGTVTYPIGDNSETITYWTTAPGNTKWFLSWNEMEIISYVNEATGINIWFEEVGETTASEKFNLMIAGEEYCDLLPIDKYYSGGLEQAYNDEVIIDITPYLNANAPDYMNIVDLQDENTLNNIYTEDMQLAFYKINDGPGYMSGGSFVTRGDWMEKEGIDFGEYMTMEEFTDYLYVMKDVFGAEYPIDVTPSAQIANLSWVFDTQIPSIYNVTSIDMYIDDGVVVCPYTAPEYYDYLEWFIGLYNDGVVHKDFYVSEMNRGEQLAACGNGKIGLWGSSADKFDEIFTYSDDPNLKLQALPVVAPSEDPEPYTWVGATSLAEAGMSISCQCEKVEKVVSWMNYFFTEDGIEFANYGIEGDTYIIDENGEYQWTEKITDSDEVPNAEMALKIYTFQGFCSFYDITEKLVSTFTDSAKEAIEIWKVEGTSEHTYPNGAGLTTEETDEVKNSVADICSAACEEVLKFITGEAEFNEVGWDEYISKLENLGLSEVLAVYQNAYDEYMAGDRFIATSSGGGPGGGPGGAPGGAPGGEGGQMPEGEMPMS